MPTTTTLLLPLVGAGGEPIDLWRTVVSHGLASLPPLRVDEEARTLTATLALGDGAARTVRIAAGPAGHAAAEILGPPLDAGERAAVEQGVRRLLRFDEDLSGFYRSIAGDPDLAWAAAGAGRMVRGATVFEDVVKTICTTNCAWWATTRMVAALVGHLGAPSVADETAGAETARAFPTPAAMAAAPEAFYREVVRAGYRGRYLHLLAARVAGGELDLEQLGGPGAAELPTEEIERRLLALPGVGPYAAAHVLTLLGRYDRLILDSWTRPTYRRLAGLDDCDDAAIAARFAPYGRYAGLAFWLYLTRPWVAEPPASGGQGTP